MLFINYATQEECEKNSFTGLFALLKRYRATPIGLPVLAYKAEDIQLMLQYSEDAISILLQGLQGVGHLLASQNKHSEEHTNLGFFISAISNLIEALDGLRSDTSYMLSNPEHLSCYL